MAWLIPSFPSCLPSSLLLSPFFSPCFLIFFFSVTQDAAVFLGKLNSRDVLTVEQQEIQSVM